MDPTTLRQVIHSVAASVISHAEQLTVLDQAIGDGDHGLNMKRGFEAVLADLDRIAANPLPAALKIAGTTLVMKVGGASGPLFGTLFMTLGKELPEAPEHGDLVRALGAAIDAVKKLGKSDTGQKTMLDVLVPVHAELASGAEGLARRLPARAAAAAEATVPMKAIRGRASFLGDRSIGHMDPGARSTSLIVTALCAALETPA
jgi:phosphoenolpyruvate---glycerone phosphotransferase subunit DhaL